MKPVPNRAPSAAELAAAAAQTRAKLSRHLAQLDRDYALRHILVRMVRTAGARKIGTTELEKSALSTGFVALGLGWLSIRNGALPSVVEGLKRSLVRKRPPPNARCPGHLMPDTDKPSSDGLGHE